MTFWEIMRDIGFVIVLVGVVLTVIETIRSQPHTVSSRRDCRLFRRNGEVMKDDAAMTYSDEQRKLQCRLTEAEELLDRAQIWVLQDKLYREIAAFRAAKETR